MNYTVNIWRVEGNNYLASTTDDYGLYSGEAKRTINEAIRNLFDLMPISVIDRTFTFRFRGEVK